MINATIIHKPNDIDYTIKYWVENSKINFEVFEIISSCDGGDILYQLPDGYDLTDSTNDIEKAELFLTSVIKFDGHMELTVKPNSKDDRGCLHFGSKADIKDLGKLLEKLYELAATNLNCWQGN